MLTTVADPASPSMDLIRVTLPSAGDTITPGSSGGIRSGSRKKNAMKRVTTTSAKPTYQSPRAAVATAKIAGTAIKGIPSRTILNADLTDLSFSVYGLSFLIFHLGIVEPLI